MIQLYIFMYLFFFKFFSHLVITECWAEFPLLHSRSLLAIYFKQSVTLFVTDLIILTNFMNIFKTVFSMS